MMTAAPPPRSTPAPSTPVGPEASHLDGARARLWIGVMLAPVSWLLDFMARYLVIRYANVHDRRWPMAACTAVALVLLIAGAGLCWQARRRPSPGSSSRLADWGLALAAYFLILIVAQVVPTLMLNAREIT